MKTLYSTPARGKESPSRAGSSTPCFSSALPQPARAAVAARAAAHAAAVVFRRSSIGAGSLLGGAGGAGAGRVSRVAPGMKSEAGRLQGLVPGDGGPGQRSLGGVLEDLAKAVERRLRLAPHPPGGAHLLQRVDWRGWIAVSGQLHVGDPSRLGG